MTGWGGVTGFPQADAPAGWYPSCGTGEATPEFAGIVALADQIAGHALGVINPTLYKLAADGVGTVNGWYLAYELAGQTPPR
jgi:subtilase family serine protease